MSNFGHDMDESLLFGGAFSALIVGFSIAGGCLLEGSDSFIVNLLTAALVIGGAVLLSTMVIIIGVLINRIVLGNDGLDTQSRLRVWLCVGVLAVLVAALLSGM